MKNVMHRFCFLWKNNTTEWQNAHLGGPLMLWLFKRFVCFSAEAESLGTHRVSLEQGYWLNGAWPAHSGASWKGLNTSKHNQNSFQCDWSWFYQCKRYKTKSSSSYFLFFHVSVAFLLSQYVLRNLKKRAVCVFELSVAIYMLLQWGNIRCVNLGGKKKKGVNIRMKAVFVCFPSALL